MALSETKIVEITKAINQLVHTTRDRDRSVDAEAFERTAVLRAEHAAQLEAAVAAARAEARTAIDTDFRSKLAYVCFGDPDMIRLGEGLLLTSRREGGTKRRPNGSRAFVTRTTTLTPEQDVYLLQVRQRTGVNLSSALRACVQQCLEREASGTAPAAEPQRPLTGKEYIQKHFVRPPTRVTHSAPKK